MNGVMGLPKMRCSLYASWGWGYINIVSKKAQKNADASTLSKMGQAASVLVVTQIQTL
jgi:hypothetical protein